MKTVKPSKNIKDGIRNLINASIEDYNEFCDNKNMQNEFANSWTVKEGQKFIKLVAKHSVHSFIVKKAFKHFKEGDVLKAASWAAPALNQPRGNVLEGNYPIQWTGPLYLK
jgi:hypothetical protein